MLSYKELQPAIRRDFTTKNMLRTSWQWQVGNFGCFFLSLCQMLGKEFPSYDALGDFYKRCIGHGLKSNEEWWSWVNDPGALATFIADRRLSQYKSTILPTDNKLVIGNYLNDYGQHFKYIHGHDTESPMNCTLVDYRIFK